MIVSVLLLADGEEVFKPYQFKMDEIEGLRYRSKVSNRDIVLVCVLGMVGLAVRNLRVCI